MLETDCYLMAQLDEQVPEILLQDVKVLFIALVEQKTLGLLIPRWIALERVRGVCYELSQFHVTHYSVQRCASTILRLGCLLKHAAFLMSSDLLPDWLNEKPWQVPEDLHLTVAQLTQVICGLYFEKTMECRHWGQTHDSWRHKEIECL